MRTFKYILNVLGIALMYWFSNLSFALIVKFPKCDQVRNLVLKVLSNLALDFLVYLIVISAINLLIEKKIIDKYFSRENYLLLFINIVCCCTFALYFANEFEKNCDTKKIKIEWKENLEGDFTFKSKKKSLKAEVWCYEYVEIDNIEIKRISRDSLSCQTFINMATHSALKFYIVNGFVCDSRIELTGIAAGNNKIYPLKSGSFKMDKNAFSKNYVKADFNFDFLHEENPKQKMFWKGKIYAKIQ